MSDRANDENQKTLMFLGRDLASIPCFRNSFLYGIGTGIGSGLCYFMFSSKPKVSTHVGFGTFFCTTLTYWFYCRYEWSKKKFTVGQLQGAMKKPFTVYEASSSEDEASK